MPLRHGMDTADVLITITARNEEERLGDYGEYMALF